MGEWVQFNSYSQLLLFALLVIGMFKGHIPAPKAPTLVPLAPECLRIKQLEEQPSTLRNSVICTFTLDLNYGRFDAYQALTAWSLVTFF